MEWKAPSCGYCNNQIGTPHEAVFIFDIWGDHFFHAECYAKKLGAVAKDGRFIGAGAALSGGGALTGLSAYNKIKDIEKIAEQGKRKDMQESISGVSNIQLATGVVFSLIAAFVLLNSQKIKLDLIGWIAVLILGLIGLFGLYVSINYRMRLRSFEQLLTQR